MSHQSLTYELKEEARQHWDLVNQALSYLAKSNRLWFVESENVTYDWKRNSGSSNLVERKQASIALRQPNFIQCNLTPFCIQAGSRRVFFLPDRIYLCQSDTYISASLSEIKIKLDSISFTEEEQPPTDADIVGNTWRYVNKDGSPDLRFMDNCPLPILEYAVVNLIFTSGHCICMHVSSISAAQAFIDIIHRTKQSSSSVVCRQQTNQEKPRQNKVTAPQQQSTNCYTVLGISSQCTLEEASAAFRHLAKQYHPDNVYRLGPEFRQLAEERMKQINQAYTELKRIKKASDEMVIHQTQTEQDKMVNIVASSASETRLVGLEGALVGKVFDISKPHLVIGREDGCDICLITDPTISRRHAYIIKKDGGYVVHDNTSTNGTFVNGERLAVQILRIGDVVQFGNSKFRFE